MTDHWKTVDRWMLILAAIVTAVAMAVTPRRIALSVAIGAGLMIVNGWALRRIGARLVGARASAGLGVLLFNLKMLGLGLVVFLVLRYLPVDGIGFLVGISVFPVAVLIAAFKAAGLDHTPEAEEPDVHG